MTLCLHRKWGKSFPLCTVLLLFFTTIINNSILAEGSAELTPGNSDRIYLYLNGNLYNNFGRYDGSADQRLFFHVANPNQEQVYLGFSQSVSSGHYPCSGAPNITFFRIKDPTGRVVFPTKDSPNGRMLSPGTANIATKSQAAAGPQPIAGTNGYAPIIFDPAGLPAGDYYIEFSAIRNAPSPGIITAIEHWDITVATKAAQPKALDGRVFSTNWAFYTPSINCNPNTPYGWFDRPFNGRFFVLSKEGFVNLVDFKDAGFQAAAFNIYFNENGVTNTGNPAADRQSITGLGQDHAVQRIFLNNPDEIVYPSGEYGTLLNLPELHNCRVEKEACIKISPTKGGQIEVLIDFFKGNGDFKYDPNTKDVLLVFNVTPEMGETSPFIRCIPWNGKDGLGNPVIDQNSFDLLVTYQQGVYHLPVYDVEYLLYGIKATNFRPIPPSGVTSNLLYYDDSKIPVGPGNNSGKIELNGCEAPCHTWNNTTYGNENTINTWFFADETQQLRDEQPYCQITANSDSTVTQYNTSVSVPVLNNDTGDIIDTSSVKIVATTGNVKSISVAPNGTVTYLPNDTFTGIDSFRYAVCYDLLPAEALCDEAVVYVTVGTPTETDCEDNIDNDQDGLTDCNDPDCRPTKPADILRKKD